MPLIVPFFLHDIRRWMLENLKVSYHNSGHWPLVLDITIHTLWKCRNDLIFDSRSTTMDQIVASTPCSAHQVETSFMKVGGSMEKNIGPPKLSNLLWISPPIDKVKLNHDGAVDSNGYALCGGLMRDQLGRVIFAHL